jgi:hypothetical protein
METPFAVTVMTARNISGTRQGSSLSQHRPPLHLHVPINHPGKCVSPILFRLLMAVLLTATAWPAIASAQAVLEISSPAPNAVINPGQTMTVSVTSPDNVAFTTVGVMGESPIGMSTTLASGMPAQLSLDIPGDIVCRRYIVTVVGRTAAGQDVSTSVTIDVERPDMPTSIRAALPSVGFEAPGGSVPLRILASFADSKVLNVTRSTNMVYASSDPAVATVSAAGEVTGLASGDAVVTATYGPPAQGIVVSIPVNVPAPPFSIDPAQLDFGSQNVGSSTSLQMTVTNTRPGALGIVSITATGDYSVTDTCVSASPIAVNAKCTITVSFAPTATGSRQGSVAIANSVTILPVAFVVTGTGATPRRVHASTGTIHGLRLNRSSSDRSRWCHRVRPLRPFCSQSVPIGLEVIS